MLRWGGGTSIFPSKCRSLALVSKYHSRKRVDFPVDEVTVSVDEETGKSVFFYRDN